MTIALTNSNFNLLELRIQLLRKSPLLTTGENGLLNVLSNTIDRALWIEQGSLGEDLGLYRTLTVLIEKLGNIEKRILKAFKPAVVTNFKFHEQIWRVEKRPQPSIWDEREAA